MQYDRSKRLPEALVAGKVRHLREGRGLSQGDLAERLGWKQETVSRLERGSRGISVDECVALAVALDTSPAHLLTPLDPNQTMALTPNLVVEVTTARQWIGGQKPLPNQDGAAFWTSVSKQEWELRQSPEVALMLQAVQEYSNASDIEDGIAALGDIIHVASGLRDRLQRAFDKWLEEEERRREGR